MTEIAALPGFQTGDVSRETQARLITLRDLVLKWNPRVNLISRSSEDDIWIRHIADSAQLWSLRPGLLRHWADLGSGAGFPGLVIGAFAAEFAPEMRMTLVESDARKCAFLGEAARALGVNVSVENRRIEATASLRADVISARALAPLGVLLKYTDMHRSRGGMGLFPKGRTVHKEITDAEAFWRFERRLHRSVTDADAAILEVGALSRV